MAEIPNPIILNFDPKNLEDRFISKVFDNKFCKIIWLAMRNGREVDSNFSRNCFDLGSYIEAKQVPYMASGLHSLIITYFGEEVANTYSIKFKKELLVYLRGYDTLECIISQNVYSTSNGSDT